MVRDKGCEGCFSWVPWEACNYHNDHFPSIRCDQCYDHSNYKSPCSDEYKPDSEQDYGSDWE